MVGEFADDLDPEELAEAQAYVEAEARAAAASGPTAEEWLIRRRPLEVLIPIFALVLAGIVFVLEPVVAAVIAGLVVVGVGIRETRRVGRIRISADQSISIPGRLEPVDWSTLKRVSFRIHYPFGVSEFGKDASETAQVELETGDGRLIRLAHGPLWRMTPTREQLNWVRLEQLLMLHARAAGMRFEERGKQDWSARR